MTSALETLALSPASTGFYMLPLRWCFLLANPFSGCSCKWTYVPVHLSVVFPCICVCDYVCIFTCNRFLLATLKSCKYSHFFCHVQAAVITTMQVWRQQLTHPGLFTTSVGSLLLLVCVWWRKLRILHKRQNCQLALTERCTELRDKRENASFEEHIVKLNVTDIFLGMLRVTWLSWNKFQKFCLNNRMI